MGEEDQAVRQKENEMIDLFFRCAPRDKVREGIAIACLERWRSDPAVRVRVVGMQGLALISQFQPVEAYLPAETFHFTSRLYASAEAQTNPYFMVDDDEMPLGADWAGKMLRTWYTYNEDHKYVMMCPRSALTVEDITRHHDRLRNSKQEVEENPYWWGCPYLSYKHAIPYRELTGPAEKQDIAVEEWAKANQRKQGLMMGVFYNHFGLGLSQVQPALYGRF